MWVKRCRLTRVGHSIPMHYDTQHLASASLSRADNTFVSISLIGHTTCRLLASSGSPVALHAVSTLFLATASGL